MVLLSSAICKTNGFFVRFSHFLLALGAVLFSNLRGLSWLTGSFWVKKQRFIKKIKAGFEPGTYGVRRDTSVH